MITDNIVGFLLVEISEGFVVQQQLIEILFPKCDPVRFILRDSDTQEQVTELDSIDGKTLRDTFKGKIRLWKNCEDF